MTRYIIQRIISLIPIILGVSFLVFLILAFVPGDPAQVVAGMDASTEEVEHVRKALGLDRPLYVQYGIFLANAVQGDFGRSIRSRRPVLEEVASRLPYTVALALAALAVAVGIGLPIGILSAIKRYTIWDNIAMVVAVLGVSTPGFWLGLMFIIFFSVQLGWLPTSGAESWRHYILPAVSLGVASGAMIARQTRSAMLDIIGQDYIRTARAKGFSERVVIVRHALKNALIPVVTIIGLRLGTLLGGSVVIEMVFAWPGLGRLLVESIGFRDFPMVQVGILLLACGFLFANLLVDILYVYLDPRIRYG